MQELLFKGFKGQSADEELDMLSAKYSDDVDVVTLRGQLKLLPGIAERKQLKGHKMNILEVIRFAQSLNPGERIFLSEVITVVKMMLLAPATNAISERPFSALKRLKTYMRATMGDERLNSLMILHIHREKTDKLNLIDVANEFVGENESRKRMFGKSAEQDIVVKKEFKSVAVQTGGENFINDSHYHYLMYP